MRYRMYVDEVGDPGLKNCDDERYRYLSLTGVVVDLNYIDSFIFPEMESIKRKYFNHHADEPLIFHRKELLSKKYPFLQLQDQNIEKQFNSDLLNFIATAQYRVFMAIIDKLEHKEKYSVWHYEPYHYCLKILVERYVLYLKSIQANGDIMAESRGGKEDEKLKKSYKKIYDEGTEYVNKSYCQKYLTTCQLKIKDKQSNICGLQLADIIAHPCHKFAIATKLKQVPPDSFGGKIADIVITQKYNRDIRGRIDGWGIKWLP